jgi:hypothetical protein
MKVRSAGLALVIVSGLFGWACGTNNPARPSMSFLAPVADAPANGVAYNFTQQPIVLQIVNAVRTGGGTVSYNVEVSSSNTFGSLAVALEGIAEGTGGTTNVQLPQLLGNTTYFWRWRAVVDGVAGEPSAIQSFFLRPNVVIQAPAPVTPADGEAVFSTRPTFTVTNAARTGPAGTIFYDFQVSTSAAFGSLVASATIQESSNQTSWTPSVDLPEGALFWRVRAKDPSSDVTGPFTGSLAFDRRFGVDLDKVVYVHGPNISNWPQTGTMTAAYKTGDVVCTEFTTSVNWPNAPFLGDPGTPVVANQWVFALVNGVWYGGSGHWLRPNQFCKAEYDDAFFVDAFRTAPVFNSLVLRSGDVFGVAVTTPNRFYPDGKTIDHRSDVKLIVW